MLRGRADEGLEGGELRTSLKAGDDAAFVRVKAAAGLAKPSLKSLQVSAPFERFEKSTGAMFSELSSSDTSDAFRLTGEFESASPG
jgi:hypothetical protein